MSSNALFICHRSTTRTIIHRHLLFSCPRFCSTVLLKTPSSLSFSACANRSRGWQFLTKDVAMHPIKLSNDSSPGRAQTLSARRKLRQVVCYCSTQRPQGTHRPWRSYMDTTALLQSTAGSEWLRTSSPTRDIKDRSRPRPNRHVC